MNNLYQDLYYSAAASEWAGWALAYLEFARSVNPITTRGADYAHHITTSPSRLENTVAPLSYTENKCVYKIYLINTLHLPSKV